MVTREPGGTELGERVRELVLGGTKISPWAEAALFAAARAELVVGGDRPALERGADVVCDRYLDSSLAYQGIARGLGVERVLALNIDAIRGMLPDLTFLLLSTRRRRRGVPARPSDRIEREGAGVPRARRHGVPRARLDLRRADRHARRARPPEEMAEEVRAKLPGLS